MRIEAPKVTRGTVAAAPSSFWISLSDPPHKREVEGYPVAFGMKTSFFVHFAHPGEWRVSEVFTGMLVARGVTKMLAVDNAHKRLSGFLATKGLFAFNAMLKKFGPISAVKKETVNAFPAPIRFN